MKGEILLVGPEVVDPDDQEDTEDNDVCGFDDFNEEEEEEAVVAGKRRRSKAKVC